MSWFSIQELEYLLRIVLAAVCGGAIGFERERRSKSAGIRTPVSYTHLTLPTTSRV